MHGALVRLLSVPRDGLALALGRIGESADMPVLLPTNPLEDTSPRAWSARVHDLLACDGRISIGVLLPFGAQIDSARAPGPSN